DLSDDNSILENDATSVTLCSSPAIAVLKTSVFNDLNADGCANPNETITYTFTVSNQGNTSLASIVLNDPLVGGLVAGPVSGDTDADGELDPTEQWIYTATYTIDQDDINAGQVTNQATVSGVNVSNASQTVTDLSDETSISGNAPTVTPICTAASIAVVKAGVFNDLNADGCTDTGDTISYTFTVSNTGNVSLSGVSLNDPLLGGLVAGPISGDTNADGILDVTEVWTYTSDYAITQNNINAGQITNQATVTGVNVADVTITVTDDSDDTSVTEDDATVIVLCTTSGIAVVKAGVYNDANADGCANVGETIDYTFTVTNQGNASLINVVLNDPLLGGVIAGPVSGDVNMDGILDVTEIWTYLGAYTIVQGDIDAGNVTNQATVSGASILTPGTTLTDLSDESSITGNDPTVTPVCSDAQIALIKAAVFNDT
ncbi:MAG: hypothetical protein NWQ19_04530, partial [Nonlabens sp.]|nr:hypothetical protein [Nonlabens sp.]